jgi:uroporphyrinogen decarboxylase
LVDARPQVLGIDWNLRLSEVAGRLPASVGVQGNLDPFLLSTTPTAVTTETSRILGEMRGRRGHIFNLGHGVPPNAKLENIQALVDTVRGWHTSEKAPRS